MATARCHYRKRARTGRTFRRRGGTRRAAIWLMNPRKDQGDKLEQPSDRDRITKQPKRKQTAHRRDEPLKDQGDKLDSPSGTRE